MKSIRPSPTKSATLYKIGTIKIGNDGNKWIIAENTNGVKRWKLYKKETTKKKTPKKETTKKVANGEGLGLGRAGTPAGVVVGMDTAVQHRTIPSIDDSRQATLCA